MSRDWQCSKVKFGLRTFGVYGQLTRVTDAIVCMKNFYLEYLNFVRTHFNSTAWF